MNLTETFPVKVEEGAIFDDWSADAGAVLVLTQFGLAAGVLEEAAAIEDVVAEVLVCRAVECVGARAGDDVDDAASGTSSPRITACLILETASGALLQISSAISSHLVMIRLIGIT